MALRTLSRMAGGLDALVPERLRSGMAPEFERMAESVRNRLAPTDPQRRAEFEAGGAGAELALELVKYAATGRLAAGAVPATQRAVAAVTAPSVLGAAEDIGSRPEESVAAMLATAKEWAGRDDPRRGLAARSAAELASLLPSAEYLREQAETPGGRLFVGAALGLLPEAVLQSRGLAREAAELVAGPRVRRPLALPPGQYEMGPASTRVEPEVRPSRLLAAQAEGVPRPTQVYEAPAGPAIPMGSPETRLARELADITATPDDIARYVEARNRGVVPSRSGQTFRRPTSVDAAIAAEERAALQADAPAVARDRLPSSFGRMTDEELRATATAWQRRLEDTIADANILNESEAVRFTESFGTQPMGYETARRMMGTAEDARRFRNLSEEQLGRLEELNLTPQDLTRWRDAQRRLPQVESQFQRLTDELARRGISVVDESTEFPFGLNSRPGAASPEVVGTLGGSALGAALGTAADEENRLRGGLLGLVTGAGVGAGATRYLRDITSLPPRTTPLSEAEQAVQAQLARSGQNVEQAQALLARMRGRPGVASPEMTGTLGGAAIGGGVGAAANPDDPFWSGAAGAAIGAGAGATLGARGSRRRPAVAPTAPAAPTPAPRPAAPVPDDIPVRPMADAPDAKSAPRDYINYAKFSLDQTAESRLRNTVEELRRTGEVDKGFQSFADQQKLADTFAKRLVANPLDIDRVKLKKLSGAEIVGMRQVAAQNTQMIEGLSKSIESGKLSATELAEANALLDAAVESTNQLLGRIVRETAQTARDLGFLRQMAKLTTDPEAWIVRGKKLLGDAPMTDAMMVEIRRLAREAAEACA